MLEIAWISHRLWQIGFGFAFSAPGADDDVSNLLDESNHWLRRTVSPDTVLARGPQEGRAGDGGTSSNVRNTVYAIAILPFLFVVCEQAVLPKLQKTPSWPPR